MDAEEKREKRLQKNVVRVVLLAILLLVVTVNALIFYYHFGGMELITTFQADAEWGLVALGVYLVVFELEKRQREPPDPIPV